MRIKNGRCPELANSVFAIRSVSDAFSDTYKVQSLSFDEEGLLEVNAIHWPTDEGGTSLIAKDWESGWQIEP